MGKWRTQPGAGDPRHEDNYGATRLVLRRTYGFSQDRKRNLSEPPAVRPRVKLPSGLTQTIHPSISREVASSHSCGRQPVDTDPTKTQSPERGNTSTPGCVGLPALSRDCLQIRGFTAPAVHVTAYRPENFWESTAKMRPHFQSRMRRHAIASDFSPRTIDNTSTKPRSGDRCCSSVPHLPSLCDSSDGGQRVPRVETRGYRAPLLRNFALSFAFGSI